MQNQFYLRIRDLAKQRAVASTLVLFFACQGAFASLVVMVYHHEAMFLASDSSVTAYSEGRAKDPTEKVFEFSKNCCASITGLAGYEVTNTPGNIIISMSLVKSLESICAEQLTNSLSLDLKMDSIATRLNKDFSSFFDRVAALTWQTNYLEPTRLQFVGYNAEKHCFFVNSSIIDGTNSTNVDLIREYRGFTDPIPITVQGEANYLQTLLSGQKPELLNLISSEFGDIAAELVSTNDVSDADIKRFILEMFHLHKDNAAKLGYDRGWVRPPYRIFKITREKVVEISSDAQSEALEQSPTITGTDVADDKAIDAVMTKLENAFMANDYSYAFEVMYSPVVERMGGKEKGVETAKTITVQMKQQQIVMLSWKVRKPYRYINGESRIYAIIPYESVLTIAGQKLRQESYQLGIKNAGSQWQFINGDNLNSQIYTELFSDFPKSIKLPKSKRVYE